MGVKCAKSPTPRVLQSRAEHLVAHTLKIGFRDRISEAQYVAHEPREMMSLYLLKLCTMDIE